MGLSNRTRSTSFGEQTAWHGPYIIQHHIESVTPEQLFRFEPIAAARSLFQSCTRGEGPPSSRRCKREGHKSMTIRHRPCDAGVLSCIASEWVPTASCRIISQCSVYSGDRWVGNGAMRSIEAFRPLHSYIGMAQSRLPSHVTASLAPPRTTSHPKIHSNTKYVVSKVALPRGSNSLAVSRNHEWLIRKQLDWGGTWPDEHIIPSTSACILGAECSPGAGRTTLAWAETTVQDSQELSRSSTGRRQRSSCQGSGHWAKPHRLESAVSMTQF